jgi:hypothetical protein
MPPKRTRCRALDLDPRELPASPALGDPGGLEVLLQTVYNDLQTAHAQLSLAQARNQALENQIRELSEHSNQMRAASASKDAENARLQVEVARLTSQPSPLLRQPSLPDDRNVYIFKLEKRAKSSGGDKFVCEGQSEFNIYFPQNISRQDASAPFQTLKLLIERPINPVPRAPSSESILNMVNVKSECVKQEPLSDDDDKPLVVEYKAGSIQSRSFKSSA